MKTELLQTVVRRLEMHAMSVNRISKSISILSTYKYRLLSKKRKTFSPFSVKEGTKVAFSPVVNAAFPPTLHLLSGWKTKAYCASLSRHCFYFNITDFQT